MREDKQLLDYLIKLVEIPSVTGHEKEIADFVENFLRKYFPETNIIRFNNSVIAFDNIDRTKDTIGFIGHLDTVPAENEYNGKVIDGRLYGLGASDMKGGLAVMMRLIDYFHNKNKRFNHIYVFYEKEEGPYIDNGLEPLLNLYTDLLKNIDLAFVLEPTNNEIQVGAVGTINALVLFKGKKAHSARPWQGENAIHKAGDFIKRVANFGIREHNFEGLKYYEVMNITVARSLGARNVIPDLFELNVNYRFPPNKTEELAKQTILDIVNNEAEVIFTDVAPAGSVCIGNPILQEFMKKYNLPVKPKQAWTDVARLSKYGIDAVNFGPGDPAQAHQTNEYIPLENLYKNFEYLKDFCEEKGN
jgi:succinyl-diaminopimelate desuccinylase